MATLTPQQQALITNLLDKTSPAMREIFTQQLAAQAQDPAAPPSPQEADEPGGLWNNIKLGAKNLSSQVAGAKLMATGLDPENIDQYAQLVAENAKESAALVPQDDLARMQELMTSTRTAGEGWAPQFGEALRDTVENPDLVWKLIVQQAPAVGAILLSAAATAPVGAAPLGAGGMSALLSAGGFMTDYLSQMGVDLANPEEIKMALEIPEVYEDMRGRAARYGIGVGAFDSLAMGLAGRSLAAGMTAKSFAAEAAKSTALGMAGEGVGQAAALEGKVSVPDVFAEGIAELGASPVEAIVGKVLNRVENKEGAGKPVGQDPTISETEIEPPPEATEVSPERPPTEPVSEAPSAPIKEAEQAPTKQQGAQDEQVQPSPYPKSIIKGTYRSRRNKLLQQPKSELADIAAKYNIQVGEKPKKGELADFILKHFGITKNSSVYQLPVLPKTEVAAQPKPVTHTVTDIKAPELDGKVIKVEVEPQAQPDALLEEKHTYSKGDKGNFKVQFPSPFEKAIYVSKRAKGTPEGDKARAWVKENYKLDDTQIDSFADSQDKNLSQALPSNNTIVSPVLWKQAPTPGAAQTKIGKVKVKPVATNEVETKTSLVKQGGVAPEAVSSLSKTEAAALNASLEVARENGNDQDLVDALGAVFKKLIKEFVDNAPVLNTQDIDYTASPLTAMKAFAVKTKSMINVARTMPFMAPLVAAHDAAATFRQGMINHGLARYQEIEKRYGRPRQKKVGEVLVWMQKTNQDIRNDSQGRAYYKNEAGKLVALDIETSKALRDTNEFFKAQATYYVREAQLRLEQRGIKPDVSVEELEAQVQAMRDSGASEIELGELESLVNIIRLKDRFDKNPNAVYFPRYRNTGPFAVGFYAKKDPKGPASGDNLVLRHFASVEASFNGGAYKKNDLQRVMAQAEKDRKSVWKNEEWYTFDGRPMQAATPFLMTADSIAKKLSPNAFSTDLIASLLTMSGINPAKLQEMLTKFANTKEGAKLAYRFSETNNYSGYNEDIEDVVASNISGTAAAFTRFKYHNDLNRIAEHTRDVASRSGDSGASIDFVNGYTDYLLSPAEAAAGIREFNYLFSLGFNFSSAALQLTSIPLNYALMTGWVGPTKAASMARIGKTMADVGYATPKVWANYEMLADPSRKSEFKKATKLPQETVDLLYKVKDAGVLDALLAADVSQRSGASSAQRKRLSWVGKLPLAAQDSADTLQRTAGYMIAATESVSRISTSLIAIRSLEDPAAWQRAQEWARNDPYFSGYINTVYKGQLTKERFVELLVKDLHGSFGKENRPQLLRGELGALIWPLASFMFHQADTVWNIMRTTPKGRVAFVAFMTTLMLIGGIKALPGYGTGDEIYRWLVRWYSGRTTDLEKDMGLAFEALRLDRVLSSTLLRGVSYSAGGLDLSARIRPTLPGVGKIADTAGNLLNAPNPEDVFGIVGSVVGGVKSAVTAATEGSSPLPALKSALPAVIRNVISASSVAQNDVRSMKGTKLLDYAATDEQGTPLFSQREQIADTVRQGLGFAPARLAEARRLNYLGKQEEYAPLRAQYTNQFKSLMRDAIVARQEGDTETVRELAQEMLELKREMDQQVAEIITKEGKLPFDPSTMGDSVLRSILADLYPNAAPQTLRNTTSYPRVARELMLQNIPEGYVKPQKASELLKEE